MVRGLRTDSGPRLSVSEARRTALGAQLLAGPRPSGAVTGHRMRPLLDRLGVLQIDSVNVLARAHYLPVYSRLGGYPTELLDRFSHQAPRRWTEYWAHEASLIPADLRPALVSVQRRAWMMAHRLDPELKAELADRIRAVLATSRPLTARQMEARVGDRGRQQGHWGWNWTAVKRVMEDLFAGGELASAGRTFQFERRYGLAERLLPATAVADPPEPEQAAVALVRSAAIALGVATLASLADYYRIPQTLARAGVEHLAATRELEPVRITTVGAGELPAWRHAGATTPRRGRARALVNPFDPLVFHRPRVEQLFGVRYRLGIYTPAPQRTRGYYTLLFLWGEHLVAQIDLAAERARGTLAVRGAWSEPALDDAGAGAAVGPGGGARRRQTGAELAEELGELAGWLGLDGVRIAPDAPGDLTGELAWMLRKLPAHGS